MSAPNNPHKWLGLLKWSLNYTDGTAPSEKTPLSKEKKEFLELVMKDGVVDDVERMKSVIGEIVGFVNVFASTVAVAIATDDTDETDNTDNTDDTTPMPAQTLTTSTAKLLLELHFIIEQIDNSIAFTQLNGLPFLTSLITTSNLPIKGFRVKLLGVLSTMVQNNEYVLDEVGRSGVIDALCGLYKSVDNDGNDDNGEKEEFKGRIVGALSSCVRSSNANTAIFTNAENNGIEDILLKGVECNKSNINSEKCSLLLKAILQTTSSILNNDTTSTTTYNRKTFLPYVLPLIKLITQSGNVTNDSDGYYDDYNEVRLTYLRCLAIVCSSSSSDSAESNGGYKQDVLVFKYKILTCKSTRLNELGKYEQNDSDNDEVLMWNDIDLYLSTTTDASSSSSSTGTKKVSNSILHASLQYMITNSMKTTLLSELNYTEEDVRKMGADEAMDYIRLKQRKGMKRPKEPEVGSVSGGVSGLEINDFDFTTGSDDNGLTKGGGDVTVIKRI